MEILDVSQADETEAWLEARRGKITGTKANGLAMEHYAQKDEERLRRLARENDIKSLDTKTPDSKRETYAEKAADYKRQAQQARIDNIRLKTTADFWAYLAELWAEAPDGENPAERGHRLENENARHVLRKIGLPDIHANFNTGLWVDSDEPRLAVSPDVTELSLNPTWAIECKSLGTPNHLAAVLPILAHDRFYDSLEPIDEGDNADLLDAAMEVLPPATWDMTCRPFDLLPDKFHSQAIQYFVVNPDLKTLYFSFYDPRCYRDELAHVYLTIKRETITDEINTQRAREMESLKLADTFTSILTPDTMDTWNL